jgi:hypothetical protein
MMDRRCCVCNEHEDEVTLHKCPMCLKWYCEDCETTLSGRKFCSTTCANYFFFGDEY